MRRARLVKIFAAGTGGLLIFAAGCGGPEANRNTTVRQSESLHGQGQAGGCNASDKKDAFVLDPATKVGSAVTLFDNAKLPPSIQVDTNRHTLLATRIGVGVQVYDHDNTNGTWKVREPQANLYDGETGVQHGVHFAGPFWTDIDGSRVKGKASGEADAPTDSQRNVKWLRLDAVENFGSNNDVLRRVTFIQRVLTQGGQPPSGRVPMEGCDTVSVPYTALYVFWGQQ
ncbi:MAG: DUF3455 domain-containing protein [Pseudonocardiaceae bacterium]